MIKKIFKNVLGAAGFEIRRRNIQPKHNFHFNAKMNAGLQRIEKLGLSINTIVDVGAAQGSWSLLAESFWPHASYVLFEPLEERKKELEILTKNHKDFYFVPAAAGRGNGQVAFNVSSDLDGSGVVSELSPDSHVRAVQVRSIQDEVRGLSLQGPYLIKLDTHGFEVPIIEGCQQIMDRISLFIIESYGFHITRDSLLFWEMCRYMDEQGFRLFDMVDLMHRPTDGAFWQCDAFFIRKDHELFMNNSFS